MWSIIVSLIAGWIPLIGVTFAIGDYTKRSGALVPPAQIFIDAVGRHGGELLLLVVIGAQFFCGMPSVTANSRMIYAFSRDGAMPGSSFWHRINKRTRTPTNSIWLAAVGAFILGLPYLWKATADAAVTSIAVIGLYIACILPILLRLLARESFERGPWHLGRWSYLVGWTAVAWAVFISVLFVLPQASPIKVKAFNYAIVAVGVDTLFSGLYGISARKWFRGPKMQGTAEELAPMIKSARWMPSSPSFPTCRAAWWANGSAATSTSTTSPEVDAIAAFEHSEVASQAFGEEVHHHLLNTARQERVTDWQLRRNFARI